MIRSKLQIHDKFSIVIDVTYDKLFDKKRSKYDTITYLFIPDSLNINSKTYPPTKFYNDVRLFIKYDSPNYTLDDFNSPERSLLKNLEKNTARYLRKRSEKELKIFTDQVKMFGSTYSSILRDTTETLIRKRKLKPEEIKDFLEKVRTVLKDFRLLVGRIRNDASISEKAVNVVLYADEHASNVTELELMKIYNHLLKNKFPEKTLDQVVTLINSEQKYKKQESYISPKDKNINTEALLFKRNQLKKYIESVFFLHQDIRKDGAVIEQTLLALAAGLAMVFSTGVAFYYQRVYGNFTTPFFIALVLSYMLKDRIKGLTSMLFVKRTSTMFYDYKIRVNNSLNKKVGIIKENFVFVPLKKLGKKVKKIRSKDLILKVDIADLSEQVIQYKKKIIIHPKRFGDDLPDENITGLTDITRLNFHRFIQYMDDPKKDYILVKKREIYTKAANKVYHINIIQKFYTEEGVEFRRYRVVMNRNGIRRIEKVPLEGLDLK